LPKEHNFRIHIEELSFETIIGILPKERTSKQKVIIDLSCEYSYGNSKNNFIDYSNIVRDIKEIFNEKKFELLEEALIYIEDVLTKKYAIQNLQLKITKPDILKNCKVSVALV